MKIIWPRFKSNENQVKSCFAKINSLHAGTSLISFPVCYIDKFKNEEILRQVESITKKHLLNDKSTFQLVSSKTTVKIINSNDHLRFLKKIPTFSVGAKTLQKCLDSGFTLAKLPFQERRHFLSSDEFFEFYARELKNRVPNTDLIFPGPVTRVESAEKALKKNDGILRLNLYETQQIDKNKLEKQYTAIFQEIRNSSKFIIIFTSPSCVESYKNLGLSFGHKQITIGPTTSQSLRLHGFDPIESRESSYESITETIIENI